MLAVKSWVNTNKLPLVMVIEPNIGVLTMSCTLCYIGQRFSIDGEYETGLELTSGVLIWLRLKHFDWGLKD